MDYNFLILEKIMCLEHYHYTNLLGDSMSQSFYSTGHELSCHCERTWSPTSWFTCVLQVHPWQCWQRVVLQDTSHVGATPTPRTLPWGCSFFKPARLCTVSAALSSHMGRWHHTPARAWLPTHVTWSREGCGRGAALYSHGERQHHVTLVSNYVSLWQALVMTHSNWIASIATMKK